VLKIWDSRSEGNCATSKLRAFLILVIVEEREEILFVTWLARQWTEILVLTEIIILIVCPHAAFQHPDTPAGTPPRESLGFRCIVFDN